MAWENFPLSSALFHISERHKFIHFADKCWDKKYTLNGSVLLQDYISYIVFSYCLLTYVT